jgi:hypothetical protein
MVLISKLEIKTDVDLSTKELVEIYVTPTPSAMV